jgi:hypothetical protein
MFPCFFPHFFPQNFPEKARPKTHIFFSLELRSEVHGGSVWSEFQSARMGSAKRAKRTKLRSLLVEALRWEYNWLVVYPSEKYGSQWEG